MGDDFACMEDWDLQAVVRGCTGAGSANILDDPLSLFAPLSIQQDDPLFGFPGITEATTFFDDLEEIYEPFYPLLQPLSSQTILATSIPNSKEVKEPEKLQNELLVAASPNSSSHAVKYKKRKNQLKKVVQQVAAGGLPSDMWAWRKYGQKPIKGSPHPRSYYRCSSSKGCLARKQVERSPSDPGMFIITYTAEHSHSHPTRRNSLAGSTRNEFPTSKGSPTRKPDVPTVKDNCSLNSVTVVSPKAPLMTFVEDEFVEQAREPETIKIEAEQMLEGSECNEIFMPNIILSDELFPSLEELEVNSMLAFDGCGSDYSFPNHGSVVRSGGCRKATPGTVHGMIKRM